MYRKIIFISVNLFQEMSLIEKTSILMFFSFSSFLLTFHEKPFLLKKINIIELYSNLSASLTLLLGAIYISNKNEIINAMSFFFVVLVNICFGYLWLTTIIKIMIISHLPKIKKCFPKLALYCLAVYNYLRNYTLQRNLKNSSKKIKKKRSKR